MPLTPRSWLWTLQLVGGASLLLYPGVLLANLMSLAAPTNPDPGVSDVLVKAFLWVTLGYPLVWAGLWWLSWRFFRAGRPTFAFALALPPAFGTVGLAAAMVWMSGLGVLEQREMDEARARERRGRGRESDRRRDSVVRGG